MRGLGRQTLEPWKFTNSQTPCFSATTENRRKHSFWGKMLKACILHTKNQPNKNPSPTCTPEIPSDLFRMRTCRKYLLSEIPLQELLQELIPKPKLVSPAEQGGQSGKPEAVAPITGGSSPFFPTSGLFCCNTHSWFLHCQANLPDFLSLAPHHTWTQPLFRQAPSQLLPFSFPACCCFWLHSLPKVLFFLLGSLM